MGAQKIHKISTNIPKPPPSRDGASPIPVGCMFYVLVHKKPAQPSGPVRLLIYRASLASSASVPSVSVVNFSG